MVLFCSCTCVVFVLAVLNILRMGLAYKNFVHKNCSLYVWSSLSELRFYEDVYNALAYTAHRQCLILRSLLSTSVSPLTLFWICRIFAFSVFCLFFHPYFGLLSQRPAALKAALLRVLQHVRLFLGLMRKVLSTGGRIRGW